MQIANIELTEKKLITIICAAAALAVLFVYVLVYAPLMRKLNAAYSECRLCENQLVSAHNTIVSAGKTGDRVLVAEKNVLFAIDELTKHGKMMGINFISMKPGEMVDRDTQYKALPIDMEIDAGDRQFSDFVGSLDNLKKGVIKVKSMDVIPDAHDGTRVKARLTVEMYLSKREYAE